MASVNDVLEQLKAAAVPGRVAGMVMFGMTAQNRLGVSVPDMRRIAKTTGRDHELALELWQTGIPDARMVASMIADPAEITAAVMDLWVADFDSWDVCDQVCDNLFEQTPFAYQKIGEWSQRKEEFVKRAAYALIACLAWHDKQAADQVFIQFLPIIKQGATDERNFVKKSVNWALRNIGKRNLELNRAALELARALQRLDSRAARWIAADAIRELDSPAVQARLKKPPAARSVGKRTKSG